MTDPAERPEVAALDHAMWFPGTDDVRPPDDILAALDAAGYRLVRKEDTALSDAAIADRKWRAAHPEAEVRKEDAAEGLDVARLRAAIDETLSAMDDEWLVDELAEEIAREYAAALASKPRAPEEG